MLLTVSDLEQVLAATGVSAPVRADEVTASTNDTALEMAAEGAPEWSLVAAAHQTAGRGRLGRTWEDTAGRAVLFSFVLRPSLITTPQTGLIPLLAGLCMAEAASEVAGRQVGCTWPNDLLAEGRKVGGILVEARVGIGPSMVAVVGVGVNLDSPEGIAGAGGLGDADPVALLTSFLRRFRERYEGDPFTFGRRVVQAYSGRCLTLGREVEATRIDGERVRGRAVEISEDGSLVLEVAGSRALVAFGEIAHVER